jgi:hypothetical protein
MVLCTVISRRKTAEERRFWISASCAAAGGGELSSSADLVAGWLPRADVRRSTHRDISSISERKY